MSGSFLAIALAAAVMIAFWRVTILIAAALLVAMVVSGLTYVNDAVSGSTPPAAVAPVEAGQPH